MKSKSITESFAPTWAMRSPPRCFESSKSNDLLVSRRSVVGLLATVCVAPGPLMAQGRPIRVGLSAGLTGPIAETVKAYLAGLNAPIEKVNQEKGVAGRLIELQVLDDKYQAPLAVSNTQTFLDQRLDILLGYPGTGTVEKSLALLSNSDIMLFGPFTGATHLRSLNSPNAIFVLGDYRSEVDRLINHFATIGNKRFAIAFQNDSFGKPLAEYAQAVLEAKKLPAPFVVPVEPGGPASALQIELISRNSPQVVLMFTVAGPTISTLKSLRTSYSGGVGLLSFLSNGAFISALGKDAAGVVISQVVPGPYDLNHPLIREIFTTFPNIDRTEVSHAYIVGYLTSRLFIETLKVSNGKTSPEEIRASWNKVKARKPFGFSFNEKGAQYADIAMLRGDGRFIR